MKKLLYTIAGLFIITACQTAPSECEKATSGFITGSDQSVMLGSDETIEIFKSIDESWQSRDYETLKSLIADEATLRFEDGTFATNGDEFIAKVESDYQESLANDEEWAWVINYAFTAKPTATEEGAPNERGEWVSAQFTSPRDEVWIEWYQIENGKLINWISAKADPVK
jgi:hypothetical protein